MYIVYMLECADGSLYTGITTNLARRFAEHQAGTGAAYTRSHAVVRVAYSEAQPNRAAASQREAAIKKLPRATKLALARAAML